MVAEETKITIGDIRRSADRLSGHAVRTPLLENHFLNERVGGRVLLKAEVLQHCGSFKFRGAYNLISQLSEKEKSHGVVAWSSGNHAQGIALAAKIFGVKATIIMPHDAPAMKADMVRTLGAEVILYDRYKDDREAIALEFAEKTGAVVAPSYDHPSIIEGQGTVGLETIEQANAVNAQLDDFLICCGGGGLSAGCSIAFGASSPKTKIYVVEPKGFDDTARSLQTGKREQIDISQRTICDAIATPTPGALTFPILQASGAIGLTVSDDEAAAAVAWAFKRLKLVLEPGGAVALAAVLTGKLDVTGKTVGLTLSGGNIDPSTFEKILSDYA